ncbi:hypothetical protein BT67DRAFT_37979 [Trichocladium antarcticum]|uniref:Uncharacterized protein n=1 Tax=Trichocladium antarcticum TaxID=1450529 RepID=A0AAN6UKY5_9PEZI|nr:hypothetical protein BT67DRAFT_37979 [Trichocladium antarcticum]
MPMPTLICAMPRRRSAAGQLSRCRESRVLGAAGVTAEQDQQAQARQPASKMQRWVLPVDQAAERRGCSLSPSIVKLRMRSFPHPAHRTHDAAEFQARAVDQTGRSRRIGARLGPACVGSLMKPMSDLDDEVKNVAYIAVTTGLAPPRIQCKTGHGQALSSVQ